MSGKGSHTLQNILYVTLRRALFSNSYNSLVQVGSTKAGILNGIKIDIYNNSGYSANDSAMFESLISIDNGIINYDDDVMMMSLLLLLCSL